MFRGAPKLNVVGIDKVCFADTNKAKYYFQINKFNGNPFFGFYKEKEALYNKLKGKNALNIPMRHWSFFLFGIDRLLALAPRNESRMLIKVLFTWCLTLFFFFIQ